MFLSYALAAYSLWDQAVECYAAAYLVMLGMTFRLMIPDENCTTLL